MSPKHPVTVTAFLSAFTDETVKFSDHETDLWILLNERGCIMRVWPGFTKALGYEEKNILGNPIIDYVDVDTMAMFIKSFEWYSIPGPLFRMYHAGGGMVDVRMMWREFTPNNCRMILRVV